MKNKIFFHINLVFNFLIKIILIFAKNLYFSILIINNAYGSTYLLPKLNSKLIGKNILHTVKSNNLSLEKVSEKYGVGLLSMLEANPKVDPLLLTYGNKLIIPHQMLLPNEKRIGIIINLSELRLYYFPKNKKIVIVYPIGIGQVGRSTPVMKTMINQKIIHPSWIPTKNIRKLYEKEQGILLPKVIPYGPKNPMGEYALRLSRNHYFIHGTNAKFGIGMRVSSGCIRLRSKDIKELFNSVSIGTPVKIIDEPIKVSIEPNKKIYIEVHQPLSKSCSDNPKIMPINLSNSIKKFFFYNKRVNILKIKNAIKNRSGIPEIISN